MPKVQLQDVVLCRQVLTLTDRWQLQHRRLRALLEQRRVPPLRRGLLQLSLLAAGEVEYCADVARAEYQPRLLEPALWV